MSESKRKLRSSGRAATAQVPSGVVSRLSLYVRELQQLVREGHQTISSTRLGRVLGISDAQVRKDLAYFGQFGYPGLGYRAGELISQIRRILGTDQDWPVAIVGIGNLGRALLGYRGFEHQGFRVVAAFDIELTKVDRVIEGIPIYHLDRLSEVTQAAGIKLGIIAVPAHAAQAVADGLVEAGVQGILNFAPVTISLPPGVRQVAVDLAVQLEQLTFALVNRQDRSGSRQTSGDQPTE